MVSCLLFQSFHPLFAKQPNQTTRMVDRLDRPSKHHVVNWYLARRNMEFFRLGTMAWDRSFYQQQMVKLGPTSSIEFRSERIHHSFAKIRQLVFNLSICSPRLGLVRTSFHRSFIACIPKIVRWMMIWGWPKAQGSWRCYFQSINPIPIKYASYYTKFNLHPECVN